MKTAVYFFCAILISVTGLSGDTAEEPATDWRTAAAARIAEHRQSEMHIQVLNQAGEVVPGAVVRLEMRQHDFLFGTAITGKLFANSAPDSNYRQLIEELFNSAVMGNSMKWKYWEQARDARANSDAVLAWLQERNMSMRGHTMVWQCTNFGETYPKDISKAIKAGDVEWIRTRAREHVQNVGSYYRGNLVHWDVVNELCDWTDMTNVLTPKTLRGKSPDVAEWFRIAHEADPNALLYINDYHILVGDFEEQKATYETLIEDLLAQGAPLQAIGFQGHFHGQSLLRTPEETYATLERFAHFGLPLSVTEYDTFGDDWPEDVDEKEALEAKFFEEFLITCFSHPQVNTFFVWEFWDGQHWAKNAPFFREDWTAKPALDIYKRLVFDEWWTELAEAETNAEGVAQARVFHGEYDLTVISGGKESKLRVKLTPDTKRQVVVIQ